MAIATRREHSVLRRTRNLVASVKDAGSQQHAALDALPTEPATAAVELHPPSTSRSGAISHPTFTTLVGTRQGMTTQRLTTIRHELVRIRKPCVAVHIAVCSCGWETRGIRRSRTAIHELTRHIDRVKKRPPQRKCSIPTEGRYRTRERAEAALTRIWRRPPATPGPLPNQIRLCEYGYWHAYRPSGRSSSERG